MTEEQLIEACKRDKSWAQKELYERYAGLFLGICMRYVKDRDVALDLMHDSFIKIFESIRSYSALGSFEGWMKRIVVNKALEYLRRSNTLKFTSEEASVQYIPSEEISVFEKMSVDDLLSCISELPEGYRTIFNMHVIEGYSHVEIAKALNISEGTSRSQYARARRILQKTMKSRLT